MKMPFYYNDGGRASAGFKGQTGDCVCRAVSIATEIPYIDVYKELKKLGDDSPRNGVYTTKKWFKDYMSHLGFVWTPTMMIGSGCTVHLVAEEVPQRGTHILKVSKHLVAMIDGTLHDTHDPQRETHTVYTIPANEKPNHNWRFLRDSGNSKQYASVERRCIYGYWTLTK